MPNDITDAQIITGLAIIIGVLLLSYLVTKYTKYGGGSNYGGSDDFDDDFDTFN